MSDGVVIVEGARTSFSYFGGPLRDAPSIELRDCELRGIVKQSGLRKGRAVNEFLCSSSNAAGWASFRTGVPGNQQGLLFLHVERYYGVSRDQGRGRRCDNCRWGRKHEPLSAQVVAQAGLSVFILDVSEEFVLGSIHMIGNRCNKQV
jgi:hypothetical protein